MKKLILLGSTGSIGTQTLDIVRRYPEDFKIVGMSCGNNIELFRRQVSEFLPDYIFIANSKLRENYVSNGAEMLGSMEELVSVDADIVVTAIVGICGLSPTIKAIESGKDIALANKETLVAGGNLVMRLAKEKNVKILPVDSEHSAIWQCLNFNQAKDIKKIILTASGGAFRGKSKSDLEKVKAEDALKHPTWSMGAKVTIDSATLMNKGLEIIEAMHLFDISVNNIEVVVHKESIIHSMVSFADNSVIAQMSYPDMTLPIQLALTYPNRKCGKVGELNFADIGELHFEKPDTETFHCLNIARECAKSGGLYPVVMNGANEIAVDAFLNGQIGFNDIPCIIVKTLDKIGDNITDYDLNDLLNADKFARSYVKSLIN